MTTTPTVLIGVICRVKFDGLYANRLIKIRDALLIRLYFMIIKWLRQTMNFDTEVDNFISNLEKGSYMRTSYSGKLKDEKKKRNLDALISIQGKLRYT